MEWSSRVTRHFAELTERIGTAGAIGEIVALLAKPDANQEALLAIIERHGVERERWFRNDCLDLILGFVSSLLTEAQLDEEAQHDIALLKSQLRIPSGDFAEHRPAEVARILQGQLEIILQDYRVDRPEDLHQVTLQRIFDLGYDQYLAFTRSVIERTMMDLQRLKPQDQLDPNEDTLHLLEKEKALLPLYNMAIAQPRTLGALY